MIENHAVVSSEEWIESRKQHLLKEKAFTRLRDELSTERRALPWVKVDKEYRSHTPGGERTLAQLFDGCSQLVIYHFMLGPDWEEGCKGCSFWADNFNGIDAHLRHRDVMLIAVSSASLDKIAAFRLRMGWSFTLVSSAGSDFKHDYHVSFTADEVQRSEVERNYTLTRLSGTERQGISVFYKDASGAVFHAYSCYSRGIDMMNGTYHFLDLVPKGRDEAGLRYKHEWLRLHDRYED